MGLDAGQSPPFRAHPAPGQGVSLQPGRTGAVTTPVLPSWPGDSTPLTLPTCLQHQIPAVEPHGAGRGRKVTSWQLTLLLTRVWGLRGQGYGPGKVWGEAMCPWWERWAVSMWGGARVKGDG